MHGAGCGMQPAGMSYDRETLVPEICARLAEGESLRQICTDPHLPSIGTFLGWVEQNAALAEQYARAKALGLEVLAEEILAISDTPMEGVEVTTKADGTQEEKRGDMLGHRKLQVDTRKWLLSKLAPKKYGDRQAIEHSGSVDVAATLMGALKRVGG